MGTYFRNPAMMKGGPFKCHNCNKELAIKVGGTQYELELHCSRCKTYIKIKTREPIPFKAKEPQPA
ncbi:MAG: hypothetical protein ABIG95_02550 [Candidatus Woesearchaeota archaeon]